MKVWTITLAFNEAHIIEKSMEAYYRTKHPDVETIHVLVDQHYPIKYTKVRETLEALARKYRMILVDPGRNLGLHEGFNWAWRQFNIPDSAGVIGYDPDCVPLTSGWDMAMCRLFVKYEKAGWISIMNPPAKEELQNKTDRVFRVDGLNCRSVKHPTVNSICMFRQAWLRHEGGVFENRALYGGLEEVMFPRLKKAGYEWVFLSDYEEGYGLREQENLLYRQWKWFTAHEKSVPDNKDFETWLRETGKI